MLLVKSHEFDANRGGRGHARVVLTSNRKESDVFESAAKLKWFTPDVFGAARFERLNDVWQKWRRCWMETEDDSGHLETPRKDSVLPPRRNIPSGTDVEAHQDARESPISAWTCSTCMASSAGSSRGIFTMISTPVSPPDTASTDSTRRETGRAAALIRRGRPSERVHGVDVWSIDRVAVVTVPGRRSRAVKLSNVAEG